VTVLEDDPGAVLERRVDHGGGEGALALAERDRLDLVA